MCDLPPNLDKEIQNFLIGHFNGCDSRCRQATITMAFVDRHKSIHSKIEGWDGNARDFAVNLFTTVCKYGGDEALALLLETVKSDYIDSTEKCQEISNFILCLGGEGTPCNDNEVAVRNNGGGIDPLVLLLILALIVTVAIVALAVMVQ